MKLVWISTTEYGGVPRYTTRFLNEFTDIEAVGYRMKPSRSAFPEHPPVKGEEFDDVDVFVLNNYVFHPMSQEWEFLFRNQDKPVFVCIQQDEFLKGNMTHLKRAQKTHGNLKFISPNPYIAEKLGGEILPVTVPVNDELYTPSDKLDYPTVSYTAGSPIRKDVRQFQRIIQQVDEITPMVMYDMLHYDVLRWRQRCHIHFGNLTSVPGMSELEAASQGVPVLTRVPIEYRKMWPDCPFIDIDDGNAIQMIRYVLEDQKHFSMKCREWMSTKMHPEVIAPKLEVLFRG